MNQWFTGYPAGPEPFQGIESEGVEDTSILFTRKVTPEQPPECRQVHRRPAGEKEIPDPSEREFIGIARPPAVRCIPYDRISRQVIFVPRFHRAVMEIMVSPVMRKVLPIYQTDLSETCGRDQDAAASRGMFYWDVRL